MTDHPAADLLLLHLDGALPAPYVIRQSDGTWGVALLLDHGLGSEDRAHASRQAAADDLDRTLAELRRWSRTE